MKSTIIHSLGKISAGRVAIIGLGKIKELNPDTIRIAIADACRALRKKGAKQIDITLIGAGINKISPQTSAQQLLKERCSGLYTFNRHFTKKSERMK